MRRAKKCAPTIKSMPTRVLTPGLLAGIRPVPDARELTTFDLGLYGGADVRPVTGIRDPSYGVDIPLPPAPKLLPAAIQQNPMHQVLPRQGLADAIRIGKPQRATDTEGMYPKTGYARGQKPGLATVPEHPVSGPLMPIASNFFPMDHRRWVNHEALQKKLHYFFHLNVRLQFTFQERDSRRELCTALVR